MFTNSESNAQLDIFEKFCDSSSFTQMVSRLMVTEIRRRASNKTTENASIAIVDFLEISPTVNTSADKKGWILLSTLNILVSFNSNQLISIMTSNSLSSTLVKCLYLFFDLPPCVDGPNDHSVDYLSNTERRNLLQKVFSQLLNRLCANQSALTDLTRKDDLSLLFNAITSWCPEHNLIWRKTASNVLITMAKFGNINAEYLHSKNCINVFVENIQRIVELGTTNNRDVIFMFSTFIHFLNEYANNVTGSMLDILLDDFASCFGYQFFVDFAIKLDQSEEHELLAELLALVHQFTKIGTSVLKPRPLSVNQLFIIENFSIPKPSTKNSLKNSKAFNILVSLWSKGKSDFIQNHILETVLEIYKEDKANYFILDAQNTLSSFGEHLEEKSVLIQSKYYCLLQYIVSELNYVPCKELITIGIVLKRRYTNESMTLCLNTFIKFMKFNPVFKDVYREVGLLDIICSTYSYYVQILENGSEDEFNERILNDLIDFFIAVLTGPNNANCQIFHECGASKQTFTLIMHPLYEPSFKTIRKRAFLIIQQLILSNNSEDNLSQLLVLLHKDKDSVQNARELFSLKQSVLKTLLTLLSENHRIRALFRKIGGFVSVISVIVYMEYSLSEKPFSIEPKRVWNLLRFAADSFLIL